MTEEVAYTQLDLFTDYAAIEREKEIEKARVERERRLQTAMLSIKDRFGKNAVLKGISFTEGATARERNMQVGGHRGGEEDEISSPSSTPALSNSPSPAHNKTMDDVDECVEEIERVDGQEDWT